MLKIRTTNHGTNTFAVVVAVNSNHQAKRIFLETIAKSCDSDEIGACIVNTKIENSEKLSVTKDHATKESTRLEIPLT